MLQLIGELIGLLGTVVVIVAIMVISGIKILREYQRAVVFRLGRMVAARGPGTTYVIPFVEKMLRFQRISRCTYDFFSSYLTTRTVPHSIIANSD